MIQVVDTTLQLASPEDHTTESEQVLQQTGRRTPFWSTEQEPLKLMK